MTPINCRICESLDSHDNFETLTACDKPATVEVRYDGGITKAYCDQHLSAVGQIAMLFGAKVERARSIKYSFD